MRTLIAAVIITAGLLNAQAHRDLLLPKGQSISGTVLDPDGKPIAGARIQHSNIRSATVQTDAAGKFELQTPAPALVIRKAGYRSQWLRTTDSPTVQIILQPSGLQIRACPRTEPCESITGWGAEFCFPRVPGVTASRQGQDIDYGIRGYVIDNSKAGIRHGSGPLWSFGLPSDDDVWQSVEYRETVFGASPPLTIDARGRTADGKHWRNLGRPGESASYRDVDEADALLLDRVLDGVCIRNQR